MLKTRNTFSLIKAIIKKYPLQAFISLNMLIIAGVAETLGLGALLPLLNLITNNNVDESALSQVTTNFLSHFGITPDLKTLLIIIFVAIATKAIIIFFAMLKVRNIANDITQNLRHDLIESFIHLKWEKYTDLSVGKFSNSVATESNKAGQTFMLIGKAIAAIIQTAVYALAAFLVSWQASLAAILLGTLAAVIFRSLVRIARTSGAQTTVHMNTLISGLNEALSGIKPLKAMAKENSFKTLLHKDISTLKTAQRKFDISALALNYFNEPLIVLFMTMGIFLAITYADFPMESLLIIAFLFSRLLTNMNMVQNHYQKIANFESAYWSIQDLISNLKQSAEKKHGNLEPNFKNSITFENINFSYQDNPPVLTNFNAEIPHQKITVLFGSSGAGKSTVMDMALGFLKPQQGSIKIDNADINNIDIKKWREKIGYVPQETFLFHDTLKNNITLNNINITPSQIEAAIEHSQAKSFIDDQDITVGERGNKLSGGQKQRISIARALVNSPELLIMDEPTSGLDKENEEAIMGILKDLSQSMTILIISHNPKILDIADHKIEL